MLDTFELDLIESTIYQDIELDMFLENCEFQNWLEENKYYLVEADAVNSKQGQMQWKINLINSMKSNITRVFQYLMQQQAQNNQFFIVNKAILLDTRRFPPKKNIMMKNAPNYIAALQRLSSSMTLSLNNIDLNRANVKPKDKNIAIKKNILPNYDGKSEFKQYAKNYYYGADNNKSNISSAECAQLLPIAYQFCFNIRDKINGLESDVNKIYNYINTNIKTGQVQTNMNDMNQQLQNQQKEKQMQTAGMASTNPNANAIGKPLNAAVEYTNFMNEYFGIDNWEDPYTLNEEPQPSMSNPIQTKNGLQAPASAPKPKNPEKPINTKNNDVRQYQAVCKALKDALDGRLTAMAMIYKDFLYLCKAHVASYKGAVAANVKSNPQQQSQMINNMKQ